MSVLSNYLKLKQAPPTRLTLKEQRKKWPIEFLKTYAVLIVAYGAFYLLRTNFKAAQPELISQAGLRPPNSGLLALRSL